MDHTAESQTEPKWGPIDQAIVNAVVANTVPLIDLMSVLMRKGVVSSADLLQQFPPRPLADGTVAGTVAEAVRDKINEHLMRLHRAGL